MATRSRSHADMVTIIYPPGCREITDDLGQDELIRRLKTLAHTFQTLSQAEDESTYADYTPLAIHLADDSYLTHTSRDVQLLVACCIADILRIFAPEAPYKDPAQIKTIFYFLIKQLGGLKDPKDPAFKRYFYLLENLAYVKSFNMCFDLEECSEMFCALFQLMFKIVNDEHSGKVKSFMLDVLSPLITEADFVSNDLLDIILINIVDPLKTQRKNAYLLAKDLVVKTSVTLQPYIQQFFNQVLILGKADANLQIARKVYDLLYELNLICPKILLTVLPQLEFKLKSTEEGERMGSVSLLARMFSERGSSLARNHRQLWLAFLGRYNDISVAIRIKCVQYTMHFLLNHPELLDDITETLKLRTHDSEENVRYEVVMAIVSTAKKDFDVVSQSEELLNFVKERTLDKKFKIRKEAMSGLALIYKKQLGYSAANIPEATKNAVKWIKDKILHGYYMPGMEDRLLVERLLNTCLAPFNLESEDRMKKLFLLFGTIDENASKAFIEVQKHQFLVRKCVSELITLHRQDESERRDRDIQIHLHAMAKHLPEPVKATEFIRKLSRHMLTDKVVLDLMEKIVDPDVSCADCMANVTLMLKKLGPPIMTNLYYGTVKQLLERVSSVMVDHEAVGHLVQLVHDALNNGSILEELGLETSQAGERGLRLLLVLAYVFPSHFLYPEIIKELVTILSIKGECVAPLTLSVISFIGKHKPLGDAFPELMSALVPICKQFISNGNAKQAKQAIKCLFMNTTSTQDVVFAEVLELIKSNLEPEKGEKYLTAIVALGHVAFHLPDKFPIHIKNLVSRKIVKELLMQDTSEARSQDETWMEEEDLPLETKCKIEGMKMMARWLIGLKEDKDDDKNSSVTISAQKTFRMLNAIIDNKGDLLEERKPSPAERAWLRLAAGCAMLKICEQKGVGDKYTLEQFYTLATLFVDEEPQVRERILVKLHKGLGRGIPHKCLPLDFMGLFALAGLEQDKTIRTKAKSFVIYDITKRKDYVKSLMLTGNAVDRVSQQLDRILPDYMLVFAIPILTHLADFDRYDNLEILKKLQTALWFIMEPLITKNENFSFGFYKALLEKMKTHKDKRKGDDEATNFKLWALCDLAMSILISKTTNYELKEFPAAISMPPWYFQSHEDKNFVNAVNYLPAELIPKNPKKSGIMSHYLQPRAQPPAATSAAAKKIKSETTTVIVTTEDQEEDNASANIVFEVSNAQSTGDSSHIYVESVEPADEFASGGEDGEEESQGKEAAATVAGGRGGRRGRAAAAADVSAEEQPAKKARATRVKAAAAEDDEMEVAGAGKEAASTSGRPKRATRR